MKVALVSDTHLPRFGRRLPRALVEGFEAEGIDRILHAGDWTEPLAIGLLEGLAPVDGVAGNNDGPEIHERFGARRVLELDGARIGLTHGHLGRGSTTQVRARRSFEDEEGLAAIVFGHSHIPLVDRVGETWLVNPGSPTDRRGQPAYSWALLTIGGGEVSPRIVRFTDRST